MGSYSTQIAQVPYVRHFYTGYGTFHCDSMKYDLVLHWITMKCLFRYENASRMGLCKLCNKSMKLQAMALLLRWRMKTTFQDFNDRFPKKWQIIICWKVMWMIKYNHRSAVPHAISCVVKKHGRIEACDKSLSTSKKTAVPWTDCILRPVRATTRLKCHLWEWFLALLVDAHSPYFTLCCYQTSLPLAALPLCSANAACSFHG